MSRPSCLPGWIDVPDCTAPKANAAFPKPLSDPPLAWLSSHDPSQPWLTRLGSPQPNLTLISLACSGTTQLAPAQQLLPGKEGKPEPWGQQIYEP